MMSNFRSDTEKVKTDCPNDLTLLSFRRSQLSHQLNEFGYTAQKYTKEIVIKSGKIRLIKETFFFEFFNEIFHSASVLIRGENLFRKNISKLVTRNSCWKASPLREVWA